ncbi:YqzL family protein [Paenibacillus sp. SYP-B3998]|uniref:YqzL family protein n=1 Tax=Paenibacillus sp. SYP-B3998 TaxID=2678564 RepID=A0A6G3ZSM9_9BACL|nr:YqzL family protein [Paenibacillus sp. SYP-B3998]NEW05213.1 YqzL family protein [Paenibacillus sp. SYP-B3998]
MKDFSWKYFSMTGDVDAYLLYKHVAVEPGMDTDIQQEDQSNEEPFEGLDT